MPFVLAPNPLRLIGSAEPSRDLGRRRRTSDRASRTVSLFRSTTGKAVLHRPRTALRSAADSELPTPASASAASGEVNTANEASSAEESPTEKTPRKKTTRKGHQHTDISRQRISQANRGNIPWNKGIPHSEETRRRIAETTRLAMRRPEVRARLKLAGRKLTEARSQLSPEAENHLRENIKAQAMIRSAIAGPSPSARKDKIAASPAEDFVAFEWTTESIRQVCSKLEKEWENPEFKARMTSTREDVTSKPRLPRKMSDETKAKLAERIKKMWQDPEYRDRVQSGMKKQQAEGRGKRSLSQEHRNNIRRSLLKRYDSMRKDGQILPQHKKRKPRRESLSPEEIEAARLRRHEAKERQRARNREKLRLRKAKEKLIARKEESRRQADRELVRDLVALGELPLLTRNTASEEEETIDEGVAANSSETHVEELEVEKTLGNTSLGPRGINDAAEKNENEEEFSNEDEDDEEEEEEDDDDDELFLEDDFDDDDYDDDFEEYEYIEPRRQKTDQKEKPVTRVMMYRDGNLVSVDVEET